MSLILALLFTPLLAAEVPAVDWVARAEARGDSPAPGAGGVVGRILQLDLGATARISEGDWRLLAAYQPRLLVTAPDFAGKDLVNLLNTGRLEADYSISRLQKLSLEQTLSYGRQDFSPLTGIVAGALPPTVQNGPRLPSLELLSVFSSVTSLTYAQAITRRLTLSGRAAFQVGGGADAAAQAYLLQQRGVPAEAKLSWQASPRDLLSLELGGSTFAFSNGARTTITKAAGAWTGGFGPSLSAHLGLGGGTTLTNSLGEPTSLQLTYLASAGLTSVFNLGREKLIGAFTGSVNTVTDQLSGAPYRLGTLVGSVGYEPLNVLRLTASGSVGKALGGAAERGQTLTVVDAATNWQAAREVGISVGARFAAQAGGTAAVPHGTQWAGYAAITYLPRAPVPR